MTKDFISRKSFLTSASAALAGTVLVLTGCSEAAPDDVPTDEQLADEPSVEVRVAALKGPTAIGLVDLMSKADQGQTEDTYTFTLDGTADAVVQKVISGECDIALVPANVASVLYNKTAGEVQVIDVNTLSVLELLATGSEITSFEDLAGHTVLMTGKGQTPQYVMEYLLSAAGIQDQVTLDYKSEAPEVVAALAASSATNLAAVLPQPYATVAASKVENLTTVESLGDVWRTYAPEGSELVTGVTIVRGAFMGEHPAAVTRFLEAQKASVDAVNADPEAAAKLVVSYQIIDNEQVAAKAIPQCGLVCIEGEPMKEAIQGYLSVLFDANPESVGSTMPEDNFYWLD